MKKNILTEKQATLIAKKIHREIFTYCNQNADRFEEFKNKIIENKN